MENGQETKEIEVIEQEIETGPDASGLVQTSRESVEDLLYVSDNIEKIIAAQNKIRGAVLKLAQPGDWVVFGNDKASKAELGFAGAMRIGATLGVNFLNWQGTKELGRDDIGEWYRYEFECDAIYRNRTVRVYGRASSRDVFFGKAHGQFKPLSEVNEGNIKIAARRAAMKEGVKVLFGLHHMDPSFIKQHGITLESAGGHSFKSQDEVADDTKAVTVQIESITQKSGTNKNGKGWTKYFIKDAEGVEYSTFSKTLAEEAKKSKDAGTPATVNFAKDSYGLNLTSVNGVVSSRD